MYCQDFEATFSLAVKFWDQRSHSCSWKIRGPRFSRYISYCPMGDVPASYVIVYQRVVKLFELPRVLGVDMAPKLNGWSPLPVKQVKQP